MGAWGDQPFQDDTALDWLGGVQSEIARKVRQALRTGTGLNHYEYVEVIAAAEVLDAATGYEGTRRLRQETRGVIGLHYEAEEQRLYSRAVRALKKIERDAAWFGTWQEPAKKRAVVRALRESLERKVSRERKARRTA